LNYARTFADDHNTSALFLFKREEETWNGYMFPRYREDWVGRLTYNYKNTYFAEVNGAYNGSEQFSREYRFDLFPSVALGWMISNESFMHRFSWLDKLKVRGSYGLVGDDGIPGDRFAYMTQWASGPGFAYIKAPDTYDTATGKSPFRMYREALIGNPDLQWETSVKTDFAVEVSVLNNRITFEYDYFNEYRDNIFILGEDRAIPSLFGASAPGANVGEVEVNGHEIIFGANYTFDNGLSLWTDVNFTKAVDNVISREDPELKPDYQKKAGFPIGQPKMAIPGDIMQSWDDIYMSTPLETGASGVRVGYYDLVDFNNDGKYSSTYDRAPYGYPTRPQKTWVATIGGAWKGFSLMAQFYGAYNTTRNISLLAFTDEKFMFFDELTGYWSKDNPTSTSTLNPWSYNGGANDPSKNKYDASIVRLKTVELAYDISKKACKRIGIQGLRLFVNGNNLFLWTDLPDDRDFNRGKSADGEDLNSRQVGDYPTVKRYNFGFNLNF
jgi:hypothetical protein